MFSIDQFFRFFPLIIGEGDISINNNSGTNDHFLTISGEMSKSSS